MLYKEAVAWLTWSPYYLVKFCTETEFCDSNTHFFHRTRAFIQGSPKMAFLKDF